MAIGAPNPSKSPAESLHLEGGQITRTSDVEDVAGIHQSFPGGLTGFDPGGRSLKKKHSPVSEPGTTRFHLAVGSLSLPQRKTRCVRLIQKYLGKLE